MFGDQTLLDRPVNIGFVDYFRYSPRQNGLIPEKKQTIIDKCQISFYLPMHLNAETVPLFWSSGKDENAMGERSRVNLFAILKYQNAYKAHFR